MTIDSLLDKYKDNLPKGYDLVGVDGNAYSVMGYVQNALRKSKWSQDDISIVLDIMMSADYNNLLHVATKVIYANKDLT